MTDWKIQATLIQQRRQCILAILLDAYPHPLGGSLVLELLLKPGLAAVETDVRKDLSYLMESDKGYVEIVGEAAGKPWEERRYKLTGRGNEVANRLLSDPALGYSD